MGLVGGGAHAEFVLAEEGELIPVPRDMDWMEAAAIPEAFMTAFDALLPLAGLREGERVLIHAVASGVGTAAVQLASASGAITLGSSRTPAKLTDVLPLGLDHPINSSREDWPERVREICEPDKVNVILDLVGGSYHAANLRLAAPLGRIIVIGVMGGARAETDLALLLRERLRLIGTVMRSRPLDERTTLASAFTESVVPLFESGRIRPVTDRTFPFEQIGEAHRLLESNTTTGKIVLYW
jgi:NADPH:quinone reductase-like Zn-dependent oxidoreductase